MKDHNEIRKFKEECNRAKRELMEQQRKLEENGFIREANSLGTIIERLERWQHI